MYEYGAQAWRALNGLFCVFKPAGVSTKNVIHSIKHNLVKDLNLLKHPRPKRIIRLYEENIGTDLPVITSVPDLSRHELVMGPGYDESDLRLRPSRSLASFASGVTVMGIGRGIGYSYEIDEAQHIRVYHITGEFGRATDDLIHKGKLRERTTYDHITDFKLDRILASIQASHQRFMFSAAGVDIQSQEAYELAARGLIRPRDSTSNPIIYNIKCIEFDPPEFTLEVHALNETVDYLLEIVHDMGLQLKSTAVTKQVRRIRHGYYTLDHALLRGDWNLEAILENMKLCRALLNRKTLATGTSMQLLSDTGQQHLPSPKKVQNDTNVNTVFPISET